MGPGVLQVEQLRGHWEEAVSRAEHIKAAKEVVSRTIIATHLGCILPRIPAMIAGIWVAFSQESQQQSCAQELRARREGALKQEEDAEARRAEAQAATMEAKMLRLEERAARKLERAEDIYRQKQEQTRLRHEKSKLQFENKRVTVERLEKKSEYDREMRQQEIDRKDEQARQLHDAKVELRERRARQVILPTARGVSTEGGEFSPLGPGAGCFLALGSGLGLVGTASARR